MSERSWRTRLMRSKTRTIIASLENAMTGLRQAPAWAGVLTFDQFSHRIVIGAAPPFQGGSERDIGRAWSDNDDRLACGWLNRQGVPVNERVAASAVQTVAREDRFHPVCSYLDGLTWDREARLDTWLIRNLGAEDSAYTRAVSAKAMIAAVARIYLPGCKADHMLVIEGRQGLGKSSALRIMFGPWFTDEIAEFGSKEAGFATVGAWGIEVAELDGMSRHETASVKSFLSRSTDRFRPPYGRSVEEFPRTCVLIGTTNDEQYLADQTGNRRFWPVACDAPLDRKAFAAERDQLWAEAVYRYSQGEPWHLTGLVEEQALEQQELRRSSDPWEKRICDALDGMEGQYTSVSMMLTHLGVPTSDQNRAHQTRVGKILRHRCGPSTKPRWSPDRVYLVPDPTCSNREVGRDGAEFTKTINE